MHIKLFSTYINKTKNHGNNSNKNNSNNNDKSNTATTPTPTEHQRTMRRLTALSTSKWCFSLIRVSRPLSSVSSHFHTAIVL
jgi:hypothetical protein